MTVPYSNIKYMTLDYFNIQYMMLFYSKMMPYSPATKVVTNIYLQFCQVNPKALWTVRSTQRPYGLSIADQISPSNSVYLEDAMQPCFSHFGSSGRSSFIMGPCGQVDGCSLWKNMTKHSIFYIQHRSTVLQLSSQLYAKVVQQQYQLLNAFLKFVHSQLNLFLSYLSI